jgi:hypothetical protein
MFAGSKPDVYSGSYILRTGSKPGKPDLAKYSYGLTGS